MVTTPHHSQEGRRALSGRNNVTRNMRYQPFCSGERAANGIVTAWLRRLLCHSTSSKPLL